MRPLDFRRILRLDRIDFCRLVDTGPTSQRERGVVGVMDRVGERVGWARLDEAQFASCLRGEAVVEVCAPQQPIAFTLRNPKGRPFTAVWLEAIDAPYIVGGGVGAERVQTFLLPYIPGKWRMRFGRRNSTKSVLFDPRKDSPYTLPFPPD